MSTGTPLFRKPWGWPEFLIVVSVYIFVDFLTERPLLPFVSGYMDAVRDIITQLIGIG